ncbi:hypothetical protein AK812_SmicGene38864 [Symbiodinium microadriaticum]|uniref:Ubiquitin-like domain-containing protein n=1 Tax=Symbiodinium microadriaticum TaxID=2951 RepID=A0A1Q9CCP3_SYMMI|nr:hypothetical protein AK812_SmicGene38864 [Symbiodinium microadriaticum]
MSISVDVHLLSGKRASVEVEADASVESLKHRARSSLVVPSRGRLVNSSGEVLDGAQSVTEAKLMSGDVLTLHVKQVQIKATRQPKMFAAFAALFGDGSVVTWGHADSGGDSSAIQDQLRDVQKIQASGQAFAAILGDGSVVTWGDAGALPDRAARILGDAVYGRDKARVGLSGNFGYLCSVRLELAGACWNVPELAQGSSNLLSTFKDLLLYESEQAFVLSLASTLTDRDASGAAVSPQSQEGMQAHLMTEELYMDEVGKVRNKFFAEDAVLNLADCAWLICKRRSPASPA